jgi:periplasmic protein TonB
MRSLNFIKNILFLNLLLSFSLAHAEPMLNGIASHQELGKEQFIGALYSESISNNADTLLAVNQPMRMELKILSDDGISARRFTRLWIDGMAINTNPDVLRNQANNIVRLDSFFKGRLVKGDHVIFKLNPGQGVDTSVNGILLGNIKDDKFFSLMLSTWIGKVPLSSDFKDNMLKVGDVNGLLRNRYELIKPAANRSGEIAGWSGQQTQAASSSSKSSAKASSSKAVDAPVVTASSPKITLPPLETAEKSSSSSKAAVKKVVASVAPAVEDEEDSGPAFTTESLLARQFYVKELIKSINQRVRYPVSAQQKGQEGSVRVRVVLNRQGQIVEIEASEPSRYSALTKEALAAVKRAAPFVGVPEAISGDRFEFTAPIRFTLLQKPK